MFTRMLIFGFLTQVVFPCVDVIAKMPEKNRPNIVFLMSDDHRVFSLGCMGDSQIETPNMDRLARDGVVFDRAYATSPLCMASRATVMTGMYEYKTGCNFLTGKLSTADWNQSYPMLLKKAGYHVSFAGKWGFPLETKDYAASFDRWGGFEGAGQGSFTTARNPAMRAYAKKYPHVTRALGAFGQDAIRDAVGKGKPFCLSLSFKAPHKPRNVIDPADAQLYKNVDLNRPPNWGPKYMDRLPIQPKLGRQYAQRNEWDKDEFPSHMRAYYQLISGVDTAIGMVLDELDRQGVADNTVVIYTSDNGYFCGAHGLQGKVLPYDDAARIPLIIHDPRSPSAGKRLRCNRVVGNIDFAPTILALAGVPAVVKADGCSLVPLINDPKSDFRKSLLVIQNWGWTNNDHNKALAVATEEWKYICWCYADANVPVAEELFHLTTDPGETKNLAGERKHAKVLQRMQALYDTHHANWSRDCVNVEDYTRYRTVFDRTIPWQQKVYRPFTSRNGQKLDQVYKELTGKEAL